MKGQDVIKRTCKKKHPEKYLTDFFGTGNGVIHTIIIRKVKTKDERC